ncbi:MAG: FtsW/RodA/SpoVE family cell cycle protein [Defluviitaleaceae bacterium]|nr:FtsW/RodA/SpoVE family cell cycle protein [Defluviitaleaceae bacterium]
MEKTVKQKLLILLKSDAAKNIFFRVRRFDYALAAATLALSIFGVLMIHSATNTGLAPWYSDLHANQRFYVISGFVLLLVASFVDYRFITRFYLLIYGLCIGLLVLVLFVGTEQTTADRWILVPIPGTGGVSLQPSEFAKIFMIISLSKFIEIKKESFNKILYLLLTLAATALPVALILRQPSLSAGLVVAVTSFFVLFVGGLYYRTILIGAFLAAPVAVAAWLDMRRAEPLFIKDLLGTYQWQRIETYLRPVAGSDDVLQVEQSLYAIGSGGLFGKGFGNNGFVIHGHNDFIFAVTAEQFGFAGCAAVLGVVAFIIIKCVFVAIRADDLQGRMIAAGVAGMLLFETFVNVSVSTVILPNTGMPFPFLSYGGTAMWVHMFAVGMVINIGVPREKPMFAGDG